MKPLGYALIALAGVIGIFGLRAFQNQVRRRLGLPEVLVFDNPFTNKVGWGDYNRKERWRFIFILVVVIVLANVGAALTRG